MVPVDDMVAAEAEDVAHPQEGRAEQVALEREAVPIPAGHVHDGIDALL